MFRHISTPSLELYHDNPLNSINFIRSTIDRNDIRKKQPRTNPNYVNIQIKKTDGTLRSTYIRVNNIHNHQLTSSAGLSLSSSSSSSTSLNTSEQNSMQRNPHSYFNQSIECFRSDETINTDKINNERKNDINRDPMSLSSSPSSIDSNENQINNNAVLTSKKNRMMKQFVTCNDGKN